MENNAKPFLKWVGGKRQLLPEIRKRYPFEIDKNINKYVEPFVGGGAVLFDILNTYQLDEVHISDLNLPLIGAYLHIRDSVDTIINNLRKINDLYMKFDTSDREKMYYNMRDRYNSIISSKTCNPASTSLLIFLNKTCFNGLYRMNLSGRFNSPLGRYNNPTILDEENLLNVSDKLKHVEIHHCSYSKMEQVIDNHTFVYMDPPYRPISKTSTFNSYTSSKADDVFQCELAK